MSNESGESLAGWSEIFEGKEEVYSSNVIFSVSLLIIFVASLVGNILICIVIYYDKTMHTATNYYLFNLAISDLLITFPILVIIYEILTPALNILEYKSGVLTCKAYICFQFIFMLLLWNHGVLVLTALSIERYIAICYPLVLLSTTSLKRVCKIILAIWIIAITETIPWFWTIEMMDTTKDLRCTFLQTFTAKIIVTSSLVITFIIPLSIMIFVYVMIAFEVNYHQKYDFNTRVYQNIRKRKNVNKLIVALTVSFVVCWLPTYIFRMFLYYTDKQTVAHYSWLYSIGHKISIFNSWFTTVLNPLLFSLVSTKFKKALKRLWNKKIKKRYFENRDLFKNENLDTKPENLYRRLNVLSC